MSEHPEYPSRWEADVVLRDGGTVRVRPITPEDAHALQDFHAALSPRSIHLRFFGPMPDLTSQQLEQSTTVDHVDRVALVALAGDEMIGVSRYERLDASRAEVAFAVLDAHHGRGLGSVFLEHLAAAARERNIERFVADVLPENENMLNVFREAGYRVKRRFQDGLVTLTCDLDPTDRSVAVMESREHRFESASLHRLMNPSTVAVVGASRNPKTISSRVLTNLLTSGFAGDVQVVNPLADEVQGIPSYPRLIDLPRPVDLAVVLVPPGAVVDVIRDCARANVHGVVMMSSSEEDGSEEGLARQRELVRIARFNGMRLIGPNSMGILNSDPVVRLNASLIERMPEAGGLALFSQSGALGAAIVASATRRRLGLSSFVSAGNRADVSANDCMQYWEDDPNTAVLGLYLESIGNPRKFSRIARRISRRKPIVAVKSGVSGHAVPPGHGVRHTRVPRAAMDSLLQQAGVIRVDTIHQLFSVAQLLLHQPLPSGERVGIVSNSRAMAVLVADAATGWGLQADTEPLITQSEPRPEDFREAIDRGFADPTTDAVVVCYVPPLGEVHDDISQAIQAFSATTNKTTAACILGLHGVVGAGQGRAFPAYPTPEEAVSALATVARYAKHRQEPLGRKVDPDGIDRARARGLVTDQLNPAQGDRNGPLSGDQVVDLLACYGVAARSAPTGRTWPTFALRTVEDDLFGPVVSLARSGEGHAPNARGRVHRVPPLTDTDVRDLIEEAGQPLGAAHDSSASPLGDVIARVSCLADDLPGVAELNLELAVGGESCSVAVVDGSLAPRATRTDSGRRGLPS